MARKNSRDKGARGEREIAPILSTWWGEEGAFGRTPGSGSFATRNKKYGDAADAFKGDMFTPETCVLHVEVKYQEKWDLQSVLTGTGRALFDSWWKQATGDCPAGKIPVLLFRRNHHDWLACVTKDFADRMDALPPDGTGMFGAQISGPRYICLLSDLLRAASPEKFGKATVNA